MSFLQPQTHLAHQAAYEINGSLVERTRFYEVACDPRRSVVVEACAGAGKTWMLVSRIVRSLLDGVPPQQILAITFTKRLQARCASACMPGWISSRTKRKPAGFKVAHQRLEPGARRGTRTAVSAPTCRMDGVGPQRRIHTIHGWFSRLLKVAPLDVLTELQLPPEMSLIEDQTELWPDLWGRFLRRLDAGQNQRLTFAWFKGWAHSMWRAGYKPRWATDLRLN